MENQVFRKVSMDRLSSPEQLDSLMKVTSPRGWLALLAIGLLIISAMIWGFYGSLATKINGQGVLIKPGGIHQIYISSSGQITDIRAGTGDLIHKGEVIARISQPQMIEQMKQTQSPTQLSQLKKDYEIASKVVSPYTGRILEVKVNKGDLVTTGMPVVTIELVGDDINELVTVMYIPEGEGEGIIPGMDVQISPASVNKEEYGFMLGRVVSVSEFPVSKQGMMITLGDEELVNQLSEGGASLEVRIDLTPNVNTPSGYAWSSKHGPPVLINSGTLALGSIILKKERPITSVIPQIK
ncbi:NHLP bacteriocin system secretion protein [Paenibacillus sp. 19GGS1-52]|uniref:NHLP bacteriocin system secretion protein n=1 Tax=Paenibacillus sp. 19GGS1-52 TaxID=2758563 RepID=UPI001EFA2FD4|nr:NHLP bacteriocin system secretion protein [Paenibacillus sp. 19GGS1-52]ULO09860.1 NHLP bacteriocin system secretion protein [Paenibacillus sp. 19GGS1-52]